MLSNILLGHSHNNQEEQPASGSNQLLEKLLVSQLLSSNMGPTQSSNLNDLPLLMYALGGNVDPALLVILAQGSKNQNPMNLLQLLALADGNRNNIALRKALLNQNYWPSAAKNVKPSASSKGIAVIIVF